MDKSHIETFSECQLEDLGMTVVTKEVFDNFINKNNLEHKKRISF